MITSKLSLFITFTVCINHTYNEICIMHRKILWQLSYDTTDLISTIFFICRQEGATATIVFGHQAKDLTIRNGRIGKVNIHFDKNNDAKSMHLHCLISIYMYPMYKYILIWFRLTYLDAKCLITKTEYMFTSM